MLRHEDGWHDAIPALPIRVRQRQRIQYQCLYVKLWNERRRLFRQYHVYLTWYWSLTVTT